MAEARDLLKQDLDNEGQEKSAIEEITKTLNQVHFASTVKLNVGGKIYKTTLDTLRKNPDSMLCAMFFGRFELKADEEDGAYFIDCDGKHFSFSGRYNAFSASYHYLGVAVDTEIMIITRVKPNK
ncbi:hypothetical protein ACROYT_G043197 [Oculina patagonica]